MGRAKTFWAFDPTAGGQRVGVTPATATVTTGTFSGIVGTNSGDLICFGGPYADPNLAPGVIIQKRLCVPCLHSLQTLSPLHRFSAFWLRSKCSICSYQLNI